MLTLWDKRTPARTLPALAPTLAPPVALRRLRSISIPAPVRTDARAALAPAIAVRSSLAQLPRSSMRKAPSLSAPALAIRAALPAAPGGLPALAGLRRPAVLERIGSAMTPERPALPRLEPALAARRGPWEPVAAETTPSRGFSLGSPNLGRPASDETLTSPTDAIALAPMLADALRQLGRE